MDGFTKLKMVLIFLLFLMIIAIIGTFVLATIDENNTTEAYKDLSTNDQEAVDRFYEKLPDYTIIYTIIGFMEYAVAAGLFVLLAKIWSMKKI